jgi:hypothetical protein
LGNNSCNAAVICLLILLRTTARLLTFVLIAIPIFVAGGAVSKEGSMAKAGFKALKVK